VLQRYRLLLALTIALLLTPVLGPTLPALPAGAPRLVALIGGCGRDSRIPDHRRPAIW
jgi:hypothetical protein